MAAHLGTRLARHAPEASLKRLALLTTLALAASIAAGPAYAAGIALRWLSCEGGSNRNFACDRTTGSEVLVGSFEPPGGVGAISGIQVYVRVASATGAVPAWWQFKEAGSCRQNSLSFGFDMSDQMECEDLWQGQASGGIARYQLDGSNGAEMWLVGAVPQNALQQVSPGRKYAAFKLIINHQRTTGGGSCEGCTTPMCVRFEAIRLVENGRLYPDGHRDEKYTEITQGMTGMGGNANIATWQGGAASCAAGGSRPASWKQLKDLYRPR